MSERRGEFGLIDWIRHRAASHPRLPVGIGDDTAVLRFPQPADCLVTVDMLMEGVHFTFPPATPAQVGRKALAVNLSDIAAMGGRPLAAVVSVALPRQTAWDLGCELHRGLQALADEFGVALAGGDTNTWDGPLVISVTVLGETLGAGPVLRSGAQVGDWIVATGSFGGSLAGKHLDFTPRVAEAAVLQQRVPLHAMIDVSDGLSADLYHILEESRVGAVLFAEAIPISEAARSAAAVDGRTPLEHAFEDGEDFELLFTLAPEAGRELLEHPPFAAPLSRIGTITAGSGCQLEDAAGNRTALPPRGWQHPFATDTVPARDG
jgi:thiamine-monophosphate kinase